MSTSPITARIVPSIHIQSCTDPDSSKYACGSVQIVPIRAVEDRTIGTNADMSPLTVKQPVNQVYAIATDQRCLAVTKLDGVAVDTCLCPAEICKPAPKSRKFGSKVATLNGKWETTHQTMAPIVEGRFPPVDKALPDSLDNCTVVRIDPRMLMRLCDALSNGEMKALDLIIPTGADYGDPIGINGANGFGLLMPLDMSERKGKSDTRYAADSRDVIKEFESKVKAFRENNSPKIDDSERQAMAMAMLNPAPIAE